MMKDNFDNLDDLENNEEAASTEAIEKAVKNDLVRSRREITVGKLEKSLLKAFPEADAEPWDKTGLQVGNRACLGYINNARSNLNQMNLNHL